MRWGLLLFCCACGRIGFEAAEDRRDDAESLGPWSPPTPIAELNSSAVEDDPSMTGDMLELYFMSERTATELLYRTTRSSASAAWSAPAPVDELNTGGINNAKVSNDGLTLVFSSARLPNAGMADLWIATRPDRSSQWTPRRLDELATTAQDIEPWLMQSDALTIYFTSGRSSPTTVWSATRPSISDAFADPTRIAELASDTYDGSPWVDSKQQYLVFHSARANSYDLYQATRDQPNGAWSAPLPVAELKGAFNESDAWISPDYRTMLLTSDRDGNDDIFITTR